MPLHNLLIEICESTAIITFNRPERRNALSCQLMSELLEILNRLAGNRDVRAVILAANGEVFCSGHDLSEMTDRSPDEYRRLFSLCTQVMTRLQSIPQPVIAEVQGMATAAGCQLVASCDLAVACEHAEFATPGVRIGLFCTTPMVPLSRAIGRKRAMQMLLTGEPISAERAADWGLINRVVAPSELRSETRKLASQIAMSSFSTISVGKQAFYAQVDLAQAEAYSYAQNVMTDNALTADAQEGISAFLEKRAAHWTET